MGLVRIHCWSCAETVSVDEHDPQKGLLAFGWGLSHGETYCSACAAARGLEVQPATDAGAPPEQASLEPFPVSAISSESRLSRSLRMMQASFRVLREEPKLGVFPVVSLVLSVLVGAIFFGSSVPTGRAGVGASRQAIVVISLIAAYPLSFVSIYCGVALAAVLGARLDGKTMSIGEGWSAANERIGAIAVWALIVCTVGAILRLLEERLPLAGRLAAGIFGMAWSLATLFAIPVPAYERRSPLQTIGRSTEIFKRRWGAQIGGSFGIGAAGAILTIPFVILLVIGASRPQGGAALIVIGGAGMFAAVALTGALEQIYRVFVYRSAVGLDTAAGPFEQSDLRQPLSRRGR
jgi:hypothetical protein